MRSLVLAGIVASSTCVSAYASPSITPQVCKAAIAAVMGRDPAIISVTSVQGDVHFLSYVRDDGKRWSYKCKLDHAEVVWGADDGRWRDDPRDEKLFYQLVGSSVKITQRYGDGSSSDEVFEFSRLR